MYIKNTIIAFIFIALLSACSNPFVSGILSDKNNSSAGEPDTLSFKINVNITGNVIGDSVTAEPESGKAGDEITLNYTVANTKLNNRLDFSGTTANIAHVEIADNGTRMYIAAEEDALEGVITINAEFIHTDKTPDHIAFAAPLNETKTYGADPFTKMLATGGTGTGAITYKSSNTSVAAVNSATGEVTIHKVGTTEITATKAADKNYEQAAASYTLTVTPLQLVIANPTVTTTKQFNGNTTAAVTVGALANKVGSDAVTVTAVASYNSANVAEATQITVVYTISGADADNYIKPSDYIISGSISKADGGAVNTNPTATLVTATSITSSPLTASGGQPVEYAIATTDTAPSSGWQEGLVFSGLTANTEYYLFARAKANENYNVGEPKVSNIIKTEKATITIKVNITGNETGDSVTASPLSGKTGDTITINYTLANTKANNRLVFSGTTAVINAVTFVGTGTRTYTIADEDSAEGVININAAFTHADLQLNTIAFANANNEEKVYGGASFTKAITNTGSGTGAITYASSAASVAAVNNTTGAVTILKVGTATITATKAADTTYAQATASYTLTVTKLQLTIANPTITPKVYDGNTTAVVTIGALTNKVGSDTVNVTAVANFNLANVAEANLITVVYSISGASADNYIKPIDYTVAGTISKAAGATVNGTPTVASKTANSITINTLTVTTGNQTIEYAIATTTSTPSSGWQAGLTFSGLNSNTGYYVFARSTENANYNAGTAQRSAEIKTDYLSDAIAFNSANESIVYGSAFSKTLSNTGSGTGAITYDSSNKSVATVNNSGVVTILKVGSTTITATKASDGTYAEATTSYNLTIEKANGGTVSAPTKASATSTSITINAVTAPSTGQTVEYAKASTSAAPSTGWQNELIFSGLTANTNYYIFARAKANDNYNAGAEVSAQIKTDAASSSNAVTTVINFENDAVNKTYDYTEGDNAPSSVKVVTDPIRSNQKSLQISSNGSNSDKGYNQAAVIPVKLPYTVKDYESVSFKFSLVSGNTGTNLDSKQIHVYIAKDKATFKKWAFGNDSSAQNHFENNLIGAAPSSSVNFDSSYVGKWTDYSITITNPGNAIKDLTGDLFIAIGINCKTNAVYLFDDITFTPKSGFVPPPPPPEAPTTAPNPPSIGAVSSQNYRNMFTEFGYSSADVTAKVNNAWNKLFVSGTSDEKIFVEVGSDMAYIYTADTDDVRSEGMSYGMMMCVQRDDQVRFNKLWKWARTHMYNTVNNGSNNRGYFSWQCQTNGNKKDQGVAPDGEVYFITSLLFAHARWGSSSSGINNYAQEARQIIYDLTRRDPGGKDPHGEPSMFNTTNYLIRFSTIGNSATHTDPSYHLPAFYEVWALELESDYNANRLYGIWSNAADLKKDVDFFKKAAEESRKYFVTTTNSTTGLGPDYSLFDGTPTGGNHADFRFDAWRIALNIGMDYAWWAKDSWQKTFADRIQAFFVSKGVTTYKNQWQLNGTVIEGDHSPGLVGCNAVASLAASHVNAWKFIEDFWNISMTTGKYRYYDGCLYMMSMLHLSGNFKAYLSTNTTPVPSSSINPTTATFDKKTAQQADIPVTMTLNGNTLTNIKNGAVALASNTDYIVSGTTVTIKKGYLAAQSVGTTTLTFTFSAGSTQNLVITVVDTSNSSISPTTATFDKKTGQQADIIVTMTLNGNSLTSISNGATTFTSGNQYTVSGSTVTIKKEYLATLALGTTTLTFTFNTGAAGSLVITVKESPDIFIEYDFASPITVGYPKFAPASSNPSTAIQTTNNGNNVLEITVNTKDDVVILPFSLGSTKLSDYASLYVEVMPKSGDAQYKNFVAEIIKAPSTTFGKGGTNTEIARQDGNALEGNNTWKTYTITLKNNTSPDLTGDIDIAFWLPNANPGTVYQIRKLRLIPKP